MRLQEPRTALSGDQPVKPFEKEIPAKVREQLGDLFGQIVDQAIGARAELELNLDYYDALYEMRVKDRDWPWEDCSNFVVPFVPAQLDSLAARLTGVVFQPRFFLVNGNTPEALSHQHEVERFYNAELARHNWTEDFYQWLHLSLRDGTALMEILWRQEKRQMRVQVKVDDFDELGQPVLDPQTGEPSFHQEERVLDLSVYDDVELTPVSLLDFLILPSWDTDLQKSAGCARVKLMSEAELHGLVEAGVLWKDAVEAELNTLSEGESDLPQSHQSLQQYTANDQIDVTDSIFNTIAGVSRARGPMRVWRVHTDSLDLDGDGVPEENVFWIRENSRRLLGFKRYDYLHMKRPFVALSPIPRPGNFYGKSLCELLRTVQEELNAIHNQRNDEISLRLSPPRYRTRNADVRDQDGRWGPDAEWIVDSKDDVGIIEIPDVPLSSWQEEQFLTNYGYQISGQSAPMTGAINSSRRTAKEVQQSAQSSNVRLDLMAARIRQAAKEVFWQIHQLKLQYGPETMAVPAAPGQMPQPPQQVSQPVQPGMPPGMQGQPPMPGQPPQQQGPQGPPQVPGMPSKLQISKEILGLDYDLSIAGMGGPLDKEGRQQEMMLVYSMLTQNPIVAQNPMHLYSVTRMVLEAIGVADIQSLIGTPEELQMQTQQQQQQAKQQQDFQQKLQMIAALHGHEPPQEHHPTRPAPKQGRGQPHGNGLLPAA